MLASNLGQYKQEDYCYRSCTERAFINARVDFFLIFFLEGFGQRTREQEHKFIVDKMLILNNKFCCCCGFCVLNVRDYYYVVTLYLVILDRKKRDMTCTYLNSLESHAAA